MTRSRPRARAPPIVAMSSAACAGTAVGSRVRQLGQKRRLPHRLEHVEVVVAGGPVGPEPQRRRRPPDTSSPAPSRWRASCCSRDCATRRPAAGARIGDVLVGHPHAVRRQGPRAPEADRRRDTPSASPDAARGRSSPRPRFRRDGSAPARRSAAPAPLRRGASPGRACTSRAAPRRARSGGRP